MFSIINRSFAFFADDYLSTIELTQLFTVYLLFIAWIYLKPEVNLEAESLNAESISTRYYKLSSSTPQHEAYRHKTETRMLRSLINNEDKDINRYIHYHLNISIDNK